MLALQEKTLQPLRLLIVTSGIILLITCTNIAGLLLARGWARRQELATRLALGAARGRLIRQLVTESVVLSVLGGLFGIALAYSTAPFLPSLLGELAGRNWLTPAMTPGVRLVPDWSVLGLAILLALSTGILFGFLPALRTTQFDLMSLTKLRGSIGGSCLGTRTGKTLVCIQVSLSMLLLISAGLFGRTLINLQSAPIGYNPNGLLFVETDPSRNPPTFVRETLNILQTMPGVSAAAVSQWPLYNNALPKLPVCVRAHDAGENGMDIEPVSPRFFETWGVPLLSGRDFDLSQDAGRSTIVNDKFVKTFFANRNPIGQQIGLGKCPGSSKTIVGVVGDHMDRQRAEITPMVYVTYPFPRMAPTTFAVRTVGDARALVSAIRRLMQEKAATVDGDVMTGIAYVERGWRQERLLAAFLFFFGMLALLISCVGIYGLLAYSVTGRTEEIGIRMALGAQTPAVIRMITRESVVPVVAGILLGTLTFFAGVRWIESILFGISKSDPFTIIAAGTTLLLTAGIASVIPARRASRIDPMRALRSD